MAWVLGIVALCLTVTMLTMIPSLLKFDYLGILFCIPMLSLCVFTLIMTFLVIKTYTYESIRGMNIVLCVILYLCIAHFYPPAFHKIGNSSEEIKIHIIDWLFVLLPFVVAYLAYRGLNFLTKRYSSATSVHVFASKSQNNQA